jgi:hypothetical protein
MTRTDLFQLCLRSGLMLIPLESSSRESLVKWGNGCSGIMSILNQSPLHSGFKFAGTPIEPHLWGASFTSGMSRILGLRHSICILQYLQISKVIGSANLSWTLLRFAHFLFLSSFIFTVK